MLTEIYIEALLVDGELTDQVWGAWDKGKIDDQVAWLACWLIRFYRISISRWFLPSQKDNLYSVSISECADRIHVNPSLP